jgi:hypothetical protein
MSSVAGVRVGPGDTALTRTPREPDSAGYCLCRVDGEPGR